MSQASPTRALVSPYFLSTVKASWPASGTNLSIRHHVVNLRMTITNHAEMAFNLLAAAPYLVKFPNEELSQRLVQHWISTTAVALGDLSFRALCLRFALSTKNGATGGRLLGGVCSRMDCVTGVLPDVQFCSGPLVVVSNIGVCPREFPYDAYYPYDDVGARIFSNEERYEMKTLLHACLQTAGPLHTCGTLHTHKEVLRKAVDEMIHWAHQQEVRKSPNELIQEALAKGDHFSFQPRKPFFHWSGDGTIFLREKGAGRAWVVFLVQAVKRMAKDQHGMRQRETSHQTANDDVLPSGIADVDGNVHALRFVRILVTADPVDSISDVSNSASSIGSDLAKKVIAECFMDLDTIKEWCPTVGMFAGNLVKIRQLAGAV